MALLNLASAGGVEVVPITIAPWERLLPCLIATLVISESMSCRWSCEANVERIRSCGIKDLRIGGPTTTRSEKTAREPSNPCATINASARLGVVAGVCGGTRSAGDVGGGGVATAAIAAPHLGQNRAPSRTSCPEGQRTNLRPSTPVGRLDAADYLSSILVL